MKKSAEDFDYYGYIPSTREIFLLPLDAEDSSIVTGKQIA